MGGETHLGTPLEIEIADLDPVDVPGFAFVRRGHGPVRRIICKESARKAHVCLIQDNFGINVY
jgi:hypothetical protein